MNLLNAVPWYYRLAGIALLVSAVFGFGYVKGLLHENEEFDIYKAKVEALGDAARKAALEKKAQQDQITTEVQLEHNDEVARIRAYYDAHPRVVRVHDTGSRPMPAAPECPARADGAPAEPGTCPACPAEDPNLERSCALDAQQVMKLQEFLRRNNFPVR